MQQQNNIKSLSRVSLRRNSDLHVITDLDDQDDFSSIKYKKLTLDNYSKINCKCCTCDIVKEFSIDYYKNASLLLDNDRMIHIPKVAS